MRGDVGGVAATERGEGFRGIEDFEEGAEAVAANAHVDAAASAVASAHGWAELRGFESPAHGEQRIADGFGFEAADAEVGEIVVGGVVVAGGGGGFAGELVGARGDEFADEFLEGPALGDELRGEVVEQLRVRGLVAEATEVVHGRDEAAPEEVVPDAVDHDASGERVLRGGDGLGEGEAGREEGLEWWTRTVQDFQVATRDGVGGLGVVAASEERGVEGGACDDAGRAAGGGDFTFEATILGDERGDLRQRLERSRQQAAAEKVVEEGSLLGGQRVASPSVERGAKGAFIARCEFGGRLG